MQTGAATVKNSVEFPQKSETGTAFWSSYLAAGNIPKKSWNTIWKEFMHPYVHSSEIYNSQDLETA